MAELITISYSEADENSDGGDDPRAAVPWRWPGEAVQRVGSVSFCAGRVLLPGLLLAVVLQAIIVGPPAWAPGGASASQHVSQVGRVQPLAQADTQGVVEMFGGRRRRKVMKKPKIDLTLPVDEEEPQSTLQLYEEVDEEEPQSTLQWTYLKDIALMRKNLKALSNCMNKLPDKWHIFRRNGMIGFVAQNLKEPKELADNFFDRYILTARQSIDVFMKKHSAELSLQVIQKDNSTRGYALTIEPTIRQTWSLFEELTQMDGFKPLGCLVKHVLEPAFQKHVGKLTDALESIAEKVLGLWDELQARVQEKMVEAFDRVFKDDVLQVAPWLKKTLDATDAACMESLEVATHSYPDRCSWIQARSVLTTLAEKVGGDEALLCTMVANGVQVFMADKVETALQNILDPLLAQLGTGIDTIAGAALHGIDAVAGLIPEIGAAIASVLTTAANTFVSSLSAKLTEFARDSVQKLLVQLTYAVSEPIAACPLFMRKIALAVIDVKDAVQTAQANLASKLVDVDVMVSGIKSMASVRQLPSWLEPLQAIIAENIKEKVIDPISAKFVACRKLKSLLVSGR